MTQKLKLFALSLITLFSISAGLPALVLADPGVSCAIGFEHPAGNTQVCVEQSTSTTSSTGACKNTTNSSGQVDKNKVQTCLDQSTIVKDLQNIVNFLSALVGIVVIGVIILGGIQYTLAGDNQTATAAAKKRIANGLLALFTFLFAFAFLQWLIPGGIFK